MAEAVVVEPTAVVRVLEITELLQRVLGLLDARSFLRSKGVSSVWRAAWEGTDHPFARGAGVCLVGGEHQGLIAPVIGSTSTSYLVGSYDGSVTLLSVDKADCVWCDAAGFFGGGVQEREAIKRARALAKQRQYLQCQAHAAAERLERERTNARQCSAMQLIAGSVGRAVRRRRELREVTARQSEELATPPPVLAPPAAPPPPAPPPPAPPPPALTVVIVTSPALCHPSTEMVERLLLSLRRLRGLEECEGGGASAEAPVPVLISCDGYEVGSKKKKTAAVSNERAAHYEEYKARLLARFGAVCSACGCECSCGRRPRRAATAGSSAGAPAGGAAGASASGGASMSASTTEAGAQEGGAHASLDVMVSVLHGWHGFGLGLKAALSLVRTPHVLVSPHDMEFTCDIDLRRVRELVSDPANGVEYVGFPNPNNLNHQQRMESKGVRGLQPRRIGGCRLLPLCQWKENPHVTSCAHYDRMVFGPTAWPRIKKGQFIEDTVGQRQRTLISEGGMDAHREWGTFLLWPPAKGAAPSDAASFAMTHHLDGIAYRTVAERQQRGLTIFSEEPAMVQEADALMQLCSRGADEARVADEGAVVTEAQPPA